MENENMGLSPSYNKKDYSKAKWILTSVIIGLLAITSIAKALEPTLQEKLQEQIAESTAIQAQLTKENDVNRANRERLLNELGVVEEKIRLNGVAWNLEAGKIELANKMLSPLGQEN